MSRHHRRAVRARRAIALAAALAILTSCGNDRPGGPYGGDVSQGVPAPDGPLTVPEALTSNAMGPLLVHGFLIESGGQVRLCEAIAESYPPQCGGTSVVVEGLAMGDVEGVQTEGDVSWVEDATLTGSFDGEILRVSDDRAG